ncbi:possible paired amphipathic helix repeat [Prochlorococcus marinus str. NATL2A]|uniref:Possible paired amphipathic helix repeat n=1 Tax=Prochlorococcus marinus (strain NATL2A) TaxID=59920 RepID=Q46LL1_PROMT|nr:hypothetical protein [Prochlorococcus marinus]AAZ57617.1 possible paired amphipathic helix repeat [Prochlorococcus marinus str. NATL2A]
MKDILFNVNEIRIEISFKSFDELRKILSFYQRNNLYKINVPCKNTLKKDFLLKSIEIAKDEFPSIDIIPHFSILHEFKRNMINTQDSLVNFMEAVIYNGCKHVLLVSGSQKRASIDSVSALYMLKDNSLFFNQDISFGVAFNPYLPPYLFDEEILRLEKKLQSGLVSSIWIQFGTDYQLLKSRIEILSRMISATINKNPKISKIILFGSILIPSKQFLARFKYRPWKGVYCSNEFLESEEMAHKIITNLLKTYKQNEICPLIETNITTDEHLKKLSNIFNV